MTYTEEELAAMSGQSAYGGIRSLELNEVSLNGDGAVREPEPGKFERKGGYFRKRILVGHKRDEGKPEEVNLGQRVEIVFLKIRRRMVERGGNDGEIVRSTNEHDSPKNAVTLYESSSKQRIYGVAEDLRKTYENLRTVQVVYGLLIDGQGREELVRLIARGASLGSDAKAEGVMNFYSYISSFRGEHCWQYKTVLTPVLEEGKQPYFAIKFDRGEKLEGKALELAKENLAYVHENCVAVDRARLEKIAANPVEVTEEPADEYQGPTADEEALMEPNPDDIPF